MPRLARLDAPGVLHHVIIRGIERKPIFRNVADRDDFIELIRSLGGWTEVKKMRRREMDRIKGDERILGDSEFVMSVLAQANERLDRRYALKSQGYDMTRVAVRVAELMDIDPEMIFQKGRQKRRAEARGLFCYWCVVEHIVKPV